MKEIEQKILNSLYGEFDNELLGDRVKLQNLINAIDKLAPVQIEEFVLPEKWCVRGNNQKEYDLISKYVRKNGGSHYTKKENFPLAHIPYFTGNTYETSNFKESPISRGYTEITFEQFKKYVLSQD